MLTPHRRPGLRLLRRLAAFAPAIRSTGWTREGSLLMTVAERLLVRNGADLEVQCGGLTLMLPPGSPSTLAYLLGRYEPEVTAWFQHWLRPGMGFVDGGAFAGYYSILAACRVGPNGRVWAFEPDPISRSYLERNVARLAARPEGGVVDVVGYALADSVGELQWVEAGRERGRVQRAGEESSGRTGVVSVTTLDAFFSDCGWPPVDLVKLDLEAGEAAAIRGMRNLASRNPNIRVLVEVLPPSLRKQRGLEMSELVDALAGVGLVRGQIIERNGESFSLASFPDPPEGELYNLVMSR